MPDTIPQKGSSDYTDYVIALAEGPTLMQGVINEPRMFFDQIVVDPNGVPTAGTPGVFVNGEQFPVRVTHLTAAVAYLNTADQVDDQRNIQRIGLNMEFHNEFYMNSQFLPLPVWGTKPVAASDVVSFGTSAWDFVKNSRPFVLSARDTLVVQAKLNDAASPAPNTVTVNVTFTGFGMLSKRVYVLNSSLNIGDTKLALPLPSESFRNDGVEPIAITDMTVNVGGTSNASDPRGAIARVSIQVRQIGNGTQATWFNGPVGDNWCPAQLLGITSGRAVVHEFPGDGLIWEPNEGINIQAMRFGSASFTSVLCLGLAGYLMVT